MTGDARGQPLHLASHTNFDHADCTWTKGTVVVKDSCAALTDWSSQISGRGFLPIRVGVGVFLAPAFAWEGLYTDGCAPKRQNIPFWMSYGL